MQPRAHPFLLFLLRHRLVIAPCLLLLALWLPGVTQGWFRTDAPVYAALSLNTYLQPLSESWSPAFGAEPYFNKPPLTFYIHGLFLYLMGPTMLAARIPALLIAMATVVITALHARSLTNTRTALIAALVLASTLEFFRYTKTISLDLVLTLFLTAFVALIARPNAKPRHILLASIPLGLALLTKPFVALLAIPPLAIWLILQHRTPKPSVSSPHPLPSGGEGKRPKRARVRGSSALLYLLLAALIACAIAAPWHIAMYLKHAQPFLDEYIGSQAVSRITSNAHGSAPWWEYFRILGEAYWPWLIPFALAIITFARRQTPTKFKPAATLAIIWCAFWCIILSLSTDKSGRYLVPIYPYAAILCATWLVSFFNRAQLASIQRGAIPITAALLLLALASNFIPAIRVHKPINPELAEVLDVLNKYEGDDPIVVGPRAKALASNIFLATGNWPEFSGPGQQHPAVCVIRIPRTMLWDPAVGTEILFASGGYVVFVSPTPQTGPPHPASPQPSHP